VLEVWPSGHAADYETYITGKGSVVDLGLLGPSAKIGWYVPTFVVDEHPELATWEGFQDPSWRSCSPPPSRATSVSS
jgi:glycine betaine/proline transport system substrate-binding protein